jgi:ABC-type nitrate/sulfonate/bicarbonate transport system ATPase subunit
MERAATLGKTGKPVAPLTLTPGPAPGLSVEIREKRYASIGRAPPHLALAELTFRLAPREFAALHGPSGCGKTTLLHIIAGLDTEFIGRIDLPLHPDGTAPRIGYVFQTPRLLPWRTLRENIRLVMRSDQDPDIADRLIEAVGLGAARDVYPERLSGGMARRAALARAFAVEPDLLLLDEPFVSLDHDTAEKLRELLLDLWKKRPSTVLFVTHDLREAVFLADRLLLLSPAPARILADIPIPLIRPRRSDRTGIETLQQEIAAHHRRLLAEAAGAPP